ncbi:MAG: hypothetical protein RIS71_625 [Actinomycetota bacterium]
MDYSIIVADVAAAAYHHSFGQCRIAPIQTRDDSLKKDAATRAQDDFMAVGNQFSSDEFVRKSTQFGQEVIDACWGLGAGNPILLIHDVGAGGASWQWGANRR